MTFSKEQISQAFTEVLNERVPDLSNIPDHTFSERFEKNMNRLIKKEAAHPWAVSHMLARNLIAAALVIVLLFAMCMSVGAVRNKIFNFFLQHFDMYDSVIFELTESKEYIEKEYTVTEIPEGFILKEKNLTPTRHLDIYENGNGEFLNFDQTISLEDGISVDNERAGYTAMEIDGNGVYISENTEFIALAWERDGYVFDIVAYWENVTTEDVIRIFRSVQPIT